MKRKIYGICAGMLLALGLCLWAWSRHGKPDDMSEGREETPLQTEEEVAPQRETPHPEVEASVPEEPCDDDADEDEAEDEEIELMSLFEEGDSLENAAERVLGVYHAMAKEYERYLIKTYAPSCYTDELWLERCRTLDKAPRTPEVRKERDDLQMFGKLWTRIMDECPGASNGPTITRQNYSLGDWYVILRFLPSSEEMNTLRQKLALNHWGSSIGPYPRKPDGAPALSEEQREYLNDLIVTKKITYKDPGCFFYYGGPISDEDMAFVDNVVKGNPDIKLPWRE